MRSTRLSLTTVTVGAVLALAACSGSSEPGPEPTTDTNATSEEPSTRPEASDPASEASEAPEEEPAETDAPTDGQALAGAGDTACLEGSWLYTGEEFARTFEEMMSQAGGPDIGDVSASGSSVMTYDGSTFTQVFGPQEMTISVDAGGMAMEMVMTMSGTSTGSYTVDGDLMTIDDVDTSGYTMTSKVLVDGKDLDGIDLGLDDMIKDAGTTRGTVRFGCVGDELTLVPVIAELPDFHYSYTLTRS